MKSTHNVLEQCLGEVEYARLLDNANQISIFGEPVKELSRDELLAALTFTMQSDQRKIQRSAKKSNSNRTPAKTQGAGLW